MIIKSPKATWHIVSVLGEAGKRLTFFGGNLADLCKRAQVHEKRSENHVDTDKKDR